ASMRPKGDDTACGDDNGEQAIRGNLEPTTSELRHGIPRGDNNTWGTIRRFTNSVQQSYRQPLTTDPRGRRQNQIHHGSVHSDQEQLLYFTEYGGIRIGGDLEGDTRCSIPQTLVQRLQKALSLGRCVLERVVPVIDRGVASDARAEAETLDRTRAR